jgi:hypothetical protein
VQNNSTHSLDLGGFAVNATVGKNQPASPSNSSPADPLTGRLAAGKSAVGTYVFTVPGSKFDGLVVQVSSDSAANIAVFRR